MLHELLALSSGEVAGIVVGSIVAVFLIVLIVFLTSYKRCPPDKILVIYGRFGSQKAVAQRGSRCIHGGAAFVIPFVQASKYIDLKPMTISMESNGLLTSNGVRVDVKAKVIVAVSSDNGLMQCAADRLLGFSRHECEVLCAEIVCGQMIRQFSVVDLEEIVSHRQSFLDQVEKSVDADLRKIGVRIISTCIEDISDKCEYLESFARKISSTAVNDAKIFVAQENMRGTLGVSKLVSEAKVMSEEGKTSFEPPGDEVGSSDQTRLNNNPE